MKEHMALFIAGLLIAAVILLITPGHAVTDEGEGVWAEQGTGEFILQRWATQQGDWIAGAEWFVGDFNGDGEDDLAAGWNDAGKITIDVQASTGSAFTLQRWATQ
jgi:hypothetical protein